MQVIIVLLIPVFIGSSPVPFLSVFVRVFIRFMFPPPLPIVYFALFFFFFYLSNTDYPEEDENQSDKTINRREGKERMRRGRESMRREKA